jgi:hypothetical protein
VAIAIPKKKSALQPRLQPVEVAECASLIDTYAAMIPEAMKVTAQIKALQAKLEPFVAAQKALVDAANAELEAMEADPDVEPVLKSKTNELIMTKKENSRSVTDISAVHKYLEKSKKGLFMELAQIKLGDLDKYLNPDQLKECLTNERKARKLKSVGKRAI